MCHCHHVYIHKTWCSIKCMFRFEFKHWHTLWTLCWEFEVADGDTRSKKIRDRHHASLGQKQYKQNKVRISSYRFGWEYNYHFSHFMSACSIQKMLKMVSNTEWNLMIIAFCFLVVSLFQWNIYICLIFGILKMAHISIRLGSEIGSQGGRFQIGLFIYTNRFYYYIFRCWWKNVPAFNKKKKLVRM